MARKSQKMPKKSTHAKPDLLTISLDHHQAGRYKEAKDGYQRMLKERPDDANAWHLLGVVAAQQKRFQTAVEHIQRALELKPHEPVFLGNLGNAFLQQGQLGQAITCYQEVLQLEPEEGEIRKKLTMACERQLDLGIEHQRAGQLEEAETCYQDVLRGQPDRADAWHLLGVLASKQGRNDVAVERIGKAIEIAPDKANFYNSLGSVNQMQQRFPEAITYYQKALELQPNLVNAYSNLAQVYDAQKQLTKAETAYRKVLEFRPDHHETHNNLGNLFKKVGRLAEAEAAYRKAIEFRPTYADAHNNLANLLRESGRINEALACFEQVLALDSNYRYVPGMIAYCRAMMCQWADHGQSIQNLLEGVQQGKRCVTSFIFLNFCDEPLEQRRCAEIWARDCITVHPMIACERQFYSHEKIRLAYISPDFRNHPLAYLMADLIEQHDRSRFEVFGISIGPDARDPWRERLIKSFDHFLDMRDESDESVVEQLRKHEIDIAVDLAGYTAHNRAGIFASRSAPIQVNYLGFPGGMGADFIDYILADRFVIPEAYEHCYTEKVVYLPDTYQSSPPRTMAEQTPSRQDLGLPETGFVFCCFNNTYKIHPPLFDIWMRLLTQVEGSVLWLFKADEAVESNLRREAEKRGVNAERLVFAPHLPVPQYLARYRQADLFLDTLPYNAGTTASDALWAGLPLITCSGRAFVSRMGGSLLQAIGLPELITDNLVDYEAVALRLATQPEELAALRQKLERNRRTQPLFNVDRFRRHIEAAYQRMWEIWQRGESPTSFAVAPIEESEKPEGVNTGPEGGANVPPVSGAKQVHLHTRTEPETPKQVLHVGCGPANPGKLPLLFRTPGWHEVRLDINPDCQPDIVASMTSMPAAATAGYAAVFSSHNLERLYPHEVLLALKEFHRVLTQNGFALVTVPDLQSVARLIAEDQLEDPAYVSPAGPIAPLDMLYGHRPSLARGNLFMAHRTGFTAKTLANALLRAGFAQVTVKRDSRFGLWAIAYEQIQTDEHLAAMQKALFPS